MVLLQVAMGEWSVTIRGGQCSVITVSYLAARSWKGRRLHDENPGFSETARYLLSSNATATTMISKKKEEKCLIGIYLI